MKALKTFIVVMVLLLMLVIPVLAAKSSNDFDEQLKASGADELLRSIPDETRDLLKEMGIDKIDFYKIFNTSPRTVIHSFFDIIAGKSEGPLKAGLKLLGVIIFLSIAESFAPKDDKGKRILLLVSGLFIIASIAVPLSQAITRAAACVEITGKFMVLLIPVLAALIAVSGNPLLAVSYNSLTFAAAQGVTQLTKNFVVPFTGIFMATGIAGTLMPGFKLNAITEMIKKTAVWVLSFAASLFAAALSIKGLMANAADTVASKGVKLALSSLIPVVGGALSDAYASIAGSLSIVKSTVGVFGIIVITLLNAPSLIELLLWVLSLKISSACAELFGLDDAAEMLKTVASAAMLLNVVILFNAVLLIVATALMLAIKAVN